MSVSAEVIGGMIETPAGPVELTPEEAAKLAEIAAQQQEEMLFRKRELAKKLSIRRDEAVQAKRQIEQRWIESIRQYRGLGRQFNQSKQFAGDTNDVNVQPPRIQATRKYTDRWEARLSDMLFPTKDQPWELSPSPEAELSPEVQAQVIQRLQQQRAKLAEDAAAAAQQSGQPPDPIPPISLDEVKDAMQREAEMRAQRMASVIRDQLDECKFIRSGRRMVRDGCRIGAGLLMGPMNALKITRRFRPGAGGMSVEISETPTPEIREGDPWFFFPDMTPSADKAEYAFYLHLMTRREVQELAKNPGFDAEQVRQLLRQDPELGEVGKNIAQRNENLNETEPTQGRYAIWRFTGCLERDEVEALGHCGCDGEEEDPLTPVPMIDLWYSQDFILKSKPLPIEQDYRIPYYVFSPFPADSTMFGYSLPDLCSNSARVNDAALQIALHNMSVSSGPIVLMRAGAVKPADKRYDIRGPKMFIVDKDANIDDVWKFEIMPNVSEQAWAAFDRSLQLIQFEINSDQLGDEDQTEAVTTSSGLAMLLNTKSIIQRHAAACADDEVFTPVIERMYWWNMSFNERPDIKGDFVPIPKAQTVQLIKDVQAQQQLLLNGMINSDPDFRMMVDKYEMLQNTLAFFDTPNKDRFFLSREKYEAKIKMQPPDPAQRVAEANAAQAEANAQKAQADAQKAGAQLQQPGDAGANGAAETSVKMAELQAKMLMQERELQMRAAELASNERIAQDKLQAQILETAGRLNLDRDSTMAMLQQKTADRQSKEGIEVMKNESIKDELALKATLGSGI